MNSLAEVHLRQARAFLRAGDPQRAIELLEKARVLARDDAPFLSEILEALADAHTLAGSPEQAAKYAQQLGRISGGSAFPRAKASTPRTHFLITCWLPIAIALLVLAVAIIFTTQSKSHSTAIISAISRPAPLPATTNVSHPIAQSRPSTTRASASNVDMTDSHVRQCMALVVLLGQYEGLANGEHLQMDIPLSSAGAFVINPHGALLTVRHLTHLAKENNFPSTLSSLKLPTITLRDMHLVLCFGADPNDWVDATLVYESDDQDIAILHTDRHLARALDATGRDAIHGEILSAWTYPGVLTFSNSFSDRAKVQQMIQLLPQTHSANLLSAVDPQCFVPVKNREKVAVTERNIDEAEFVELAGRPFTGNGGGAIVDSLGRVIAISESSAKPSASGLGLLTNPLQDTLAPYLMSEKTHP